MSNTTWGNFWEIAIGFLILVAKWAAVVALIALCIWLYTLKVQTQADNRILNVRLEMLTQEKEDAQAQLMHLQSTAQSPTSTPQYR